MSQYFDYNFKFSLAGLPLALTGMAALQSLGILAAGDIPDNMLGDPRDSQGSIVASNPAFVGRLGIAATSFTDPASGETVTIPARGDPGYWYVAIRAQVDPATLPVDPSIFGLTVCDPAESADVLGVWA